MSWNQRCPVLLKGRRLDALQGWQAGDKKQADSDVQLTQDAADYMDDAAATAIPRGL